MEDNRRFFRIDDSVGLSYRVLNKKESRAFECEFESEEGNLVSSIDREIYGLIESQRSIQPELAQFFELVNRKLNVMLDQLDVETEIVRSLAHKLRVVSISACGVAFEVQEDLPEKAAVALDIMLQPSGISMRALARVVSCEKILSDPAYPTYYLRLEYEQIDADDKELLIKHIMRKQSLSIKAQREGSQ